MFLARWGEAFASLAVDALGSQNVHAVMMPSPYTSNESLNDAKEALNFLNVEYNELNIEDSMKMVDTINRY